MKLIGEYSLQGDRLSCKNDTSKPFMIVSPDVKRAFIQGRIDELDIEVQSSGITTSSSPDYIAAARYPCFTASWLLFCNAGHPRNHLAVTECLSTRILYSGNFGASIIAIIDLSSKLVFRHRTHKEMLTFDGLSVHSLITEVSHA